MIGKAHLHVTHQRMCSGKIWRSRCQVSNKNTYAREHQQITEFYTQTWAEEKAGLWGSSINICSDGHMLLHHQKCKDDAPWKRLRGILFCCCCSTGLRPGQNTLEKHQRQTVNSILINSILHSRATPTTCKYKVRKNTTAEHEKNRARLILGERVVAMGLIQICLSWKNALSSEEENTDEDLRICVLSPPLPVAIGDSTRFHSYLYPQTRVLWYPVYCHTFASIDLNDPLIHLSSHRALNRVFGENRTLMLTRSSFPGIGKYSGHWLGDNAANWNDIKWAIPGMLEFGLFGVPYVSTKWLYIQIEF